MQVNLMSAHLTVLLYVFSLLAQSCTLICIVLGTNYVSYGEMLRRDKNKCIGVAEM